MTLTADLAGWQRAPLYRWGCAWLLLVGLLVSLPDHARAQTLEGVDPGAIQEREGARRQQLERSRELDRRRDQSPPAQLQRAPAPATSEPDDQLISVTRVVTDPSAILTAEEIRSRFAPLEGRDVTVSEILEAVESLNDLYRDQDYLARAILPRQTVRDGVVQIRLVESRLDGIDVTGASARGNAYYQRRLGVAPGELLRIGDLERAIERFNALHEDALRIELAPGEAFGTSRVLLHVTEPPRRRVLLTADNLGRDAIGLYRAGVYLIDRSLFGGGDRASVGSVFAAGSRSYSASYELPLNPSDTRLHANGSYGDVQIIDGVLETIGAGGQSYDLALGVSHPFRADRSTVLRGRVEVHTKRSVTELGALEFDSNRVRTAVFWPTFNVCSRVAIGPPINP